MPILIVPDHHTLPDKNTAKYLFLGEQALNIPTNIPISSGDRVFTSVILPTKRAMDAILRSWG